MKKYCLNCKKEVSRRSQFRCKSCSKKGILNTSYKHGKYCSINYCIDCSTQILGTSLRCNNCHSKNLAKNRSKHPDKQPNWQGGKSFEEYGVDFDSTLKEQVRFRDNYKCQECGCSQIENGRQLDIHHIDYDKKNNNINNLIALCHRCHSKTTSNRNYWIKYYMLRKVPQIDVDKSY